MTFVWRYASSSTSEWMVINDIRIRVMWYKDTCVRICVLLIQRHPCTHPCSSQTVSNNAHCLWSSRLKVRGWSVSDISFVQSVFCLPCVINLTQWGLRGEGKDIRHISRSHAQYTYYLPYKVLNTLQFLFVNTLDDFASNLVSMLELTYFSFMWRVLKIFLLTYN